MNPHAPHAEHSPDALHARLSRRLLIGSAFTGVAALAVAPALADHHASTKKMKSGGMKQGVAETLRLGTMSLMASKHAESAASRPAVREFAKLEAKEQETIAKVLMANGASKPELTSKQQAKLSELQDMQGAAFDTAFLTAQLKTHKELLSLQEQMKGMPLTQPHGVLANMAIGAIESHIAMIEMLQA